MPMVMSSSAGPLSFRVSVALDKFAAIRKLEKIGGTGFPVVIDAAGRPIAFPPDVEAGELAGIKD